MRPDADEMQENTQEMADDYIRMACAESKYMKIPQPSGEQSINKNILIADRSATEVVASCHVWHCLHATSHCPNSTMPDRTSLPHAQPAGLLPRKPRSSWKWILT
jgi:hypothetical protein